MHREGHFGVSLAAYAPLGFVAYAAGFQQVALGGAGATLALAMAPDVDRKVPGLPHRGPTHTVWFAAAIGAAGLLVGALAGAEHGILSALAFGVFGGLVGATAILSHLLADALTPAGIRPFAPRNDREICFDVARASNPIANYGLLAVGGAVALLGLVIGEAFAG